MGLKQVDMYTSDNDLIAIYQRCLEMSLRNIWQVRRTTRRSEEQQASQKNNKQYADRSHMASIEAIIIRLYVGRIPDTRLRKQVFCSELSHGRHFKGQRKRYKNVLKSILRIYDINLNRWEPNALADT